MANVVVDRVTDEGGKEEDGDHNLHLQDRFDGDKRTYERAIQQSNNVNEELESLIQVMWTKVAHAPSREILEMEIVK